MCGLTTVSLVSEHNRISINSWLTDQLPNTHLSVCGFFLGGGVYNLSMRPSLTPNDHLTWITAGSQILPASPPKSEQHQQHKM